MLKKNVLRVKKGIKLLRNEGFSVFAKKLSWWVQVRLKMVDPLERELTASDLFYTFEPSLEPISYYKVNRQQPRVNIVTDRLNQSCFFGGVATSLIVATLFANKEGIPLRIITRDISTPSNYSFFLNLMKIPRPAHVEFFSDYDRSLASYSRKLDVSEKDIFIATSWWSAKVIKAMNLRDSFFYLFQEMEKFFYPHGDAQFLCDNVLNDPQIHYILNSKLLSDYYINNNPPQLLNKRSVFEPAFPKHLYFAKTSPLEKKKHKLFFYSRPSNPRNLFSVGLQLLDEAIKRNILKPEEWEIHLAGSDEIPEFTFSTGIKPKNLGVMPWSKYLEFIKDVDLGLSLMYSPHPSYPPLDIAACGGVVLTNKYANKQELSYSKNIICVDLDLDSLIQGFERAVALAKNKNLRHQNYLENTLHIDWNTALEHTLNFMAQQTPNT